MNSIVITLAMATLVAVLLFAVVHYLRSRQDPATRNADDAVRRDDSSAHTAVRGGSRPDHMKQ